MLKSNHKDIFKGITKPIESAKQRMLRKPHYLKLLLSKRKSYLANRNHRIYSNNTNNTIL